MKPLGWKVSVLENWPSFWRGNDAFSTTEPQELLGCGPVWRPLGLGDNVDSSREQLYLDSFFD